MRKPILLLIALAGVGAAAYWMFMKQTSSTPSLAGPSKVVRTSSPEKAVLGVEVARLRRSGGGGN